jgi:hypothetical protein
MRLINSHHFTNDKAFETYHLNAEDRKRLGIPECDVIGFLRADADPTAKRPMIMMRPDEALILARLLIDAVYQVTEGYATERPRAATDSFEVFRNRMRELGVNAIVGEDFTERKPLVLELVEDPRESYGIDVTHTDDRLDSKVESQP